MSRGRLISSVLAEIQPFVTTVAQDPDFKEPCLVHSSDDAAGQTPPTAGEPFRLPCQVEPDEMGALNMLANGDAPRTKLNLIFHARDIRAANAMPKRRDRLLALYSKRGELLLDASASAPLHAVEVRPISFGLGRNCVANLLRVTFRERAQGVRRGA